MSCKFTVKQVKKAADLAYQEYENYMRKIRVQTKRFLAAAEKEHRPVIVIAGRPYHIDLRLIMVLIILSVNLAQLLYQKTV